MPWGRFSIYHEHPFEDGSGTRLANFPDGVWGAFFIPESKKIITAVLYEYIDTMDQSGISVGSGKDNYFANGIYSSGWSYEKNIIGLPFVIFDENVEVSDKYNPITSNRSKVHHLGISGSLSKFDWKIKSTYAQYLGTYRKTFSPEWNYWYNYGSLSYKSEKIGTFTLMGGVDFSNVSSTLVAGGIEYSYKF